MLPGRTITRKCTACGNRMSQTTYRSFNNFGATLWTDLNVDDFMLAPPTGGLVKCGYCGTVVWLGEQPETPHTEFAPDSPDDRRHYPGTPDFADYARIVAAGFDNPSRERYVREMMWWAGNDRRRKSGSPLPLEPVEIDNLRALLPMFDENTSDDRLKRAEAHRELGEFDAAAKMLQVQFPEGYDKIAVFLWDLVQRRETMVTKVTTVVL
jgi:hypothetical protein